MKRRKLPLALSALLVLSGIGTSWSAEEPSRFTPPYEAAFLAERVDAAWSAKKSREIRESLTPLSAALSSSQIECKTSRCRVVLVMTTAKEGDSEKQLAQRVANWARELSQRVGFNQADTDFVSGSPEIVTYFSVTSVNP
jgi:hypothetical protein